MAEEEEGDRPETRPLAPPGLDASQIQALREKAAKAEEYLELSKRLRADLLNYQDRIAREKQTWTRQALEEFIRDILPALDTFTWARFEEPTLMESLRLMEREFLRVLAKQGVVPIDTQGKTFDPHLHEAVGVQEQDSGVEGAILQEVRRGWRMGDHVLRPASVRIARIKPPAAKDSGGPGTPLGDPGKRAHEG